MLEKYRKHELESDHAIVLTPMIDIVFQLLLFFILASNFSQPNQVQLDLPKSTSSAKAGQTSALIVSYRPAEGHPGTDLRLNGATIDDLPHLASAMRAASDPQQGLPVEIRIDRGVPYQEVITIMDTVRDAGFSKFSLLTLAPDLSRGAALPPPPPPPPEVVETTDVAAPAHPEA